MLEDEVYCCQLTKIHETHQKKLHWRPCWCGLWRWCNLVEPGPPKGQSILQGRRQVRQDACAHRGSFCTHNKSRSVDCAFQCRVGTLTEVVNVNMNSGFQSVACHSQRGIYKVQQSECSEVNRFWFHLSVLISYCPWSLLCWRLMLGMCLLLC